RAFGSDLPRGDAIWLTGIGTLGNAFGGIPFGTALKFTLLVKRFDMTTSSVFWTYFFYSVINAVVMFFAGALIARAAGYPVSLSGLLALPGALVAIGIFMVRNVQATRRIAPTALAALVDSPFLARTVCICVANVALMLGAFLTLLWGDTSWQSIASALVSVTVAVPIGFLTGLPSLGGLLEVLLGAVGLLFDFPMQHGIQLGLLLRAASVIAAAALVACAARHLVKAWRGRHLDR
ncbi:MAG: hypothetical protein K0U93_03605, partial [Gammaproteobacteria bacterium]|nr:hypothetical protein [Gammaproteobacteria bacterium]